MNVLKKLIGLRRKRPVYANQYASTPVAPAAYASCDCFDAYGSWEREYWAGEFDEEGKRRERFPLPRFRVEMHHDTPSSSDRAWAIAMEILHDAARNGVKELNLGAVMDRQDFMALHTLPDLIGELKDLEKLVLYGSNMSYLPRALAGCINLRFLEPYTSYRLHWLPYELHRCRQLVSSTMSTRALYGNVKFRPPFPDLTGNPWNWPTGGPRCSICDREGERLDQYWVSQRIATDVVPLLVSVCGPECLSRVGHGAEGHVPVAHRGGPDIAQQDPIWMR